MINIIPVHVRGKGITKFIKLFLPVHLGGDTVNFWNYFAVWVNLNLKYGKFRLRLTIDTREPVWNWIKTHKTKTILEIGLGNGENAKVMMRLAGNCQYYCFDNLSWTGYYDTISGIFKRLDKLFNTHFYIGDTLKTLPQFVDKLPKMDLIFIDGAHDYEHVKNDWNYCKKLMHDGTACFFHDCHTGGVRQFFPEIDDKKYKIEFFSVNGVGCVFARVQLYAISSPITSPVKNMST